MPRPSIAAVLMVVALACCGGGAVTSVVVSEVAAQSTGAALGPEKQSTRRGVTFRGGVSAGCSVVIYGRLFLVMGESRLPLTSTCLGET